MVQRDDPVVAALSQEPRTDTFQRVLRTIELETAIEQCCIRREHLDADVGEVEDAARRLGNTMTIVASTSAAYCSGNQIVTAGSSCTPLNTVSGTDIESIVVGFVLSFHANQGISKPLKVNPSKIIFRIMHIVWIQHHLPSVLPE